MIAHRSGRIPSLLGIDKIRQLSLAHPGGASDDLVPLVPLVPLAPVRYGLRAPVCSTLGRRRQAETGWLDRSQMVEWIADLRRGTPH